MSPKPDPSTVPDPEAQIRAWIDRSPLPGLVWPDYEGLCVTQVSEIVRASLGKPSEVPNSLASFAEPADRVILVIMDGLGYHTLACCRSESPVVERLMGAARIGCLTSTFPSTTPAALTSLYTGAAPREHGVAGGRLYLRERGCVVHMVRFSPPDDPRRDALAEGGLDLKTFCPVSTVFERLGRRPGGLAWVPKEIQDNSLCRICTAGSEVHPFLTPAQAVVGMRKALQNDGPRFQCLYWDTTDRLSHIRGPYSEEIRAEVGSFFTLLESELLTASTSGRSVKVLLSADHGHALTRKEQILLLDDFPSIKECLAAPPTGSIRAPYLQALPGCEETLKSRCAALEERFWVVDAQEMRAAGLFGVGPEHPELRHRIGTVLLIPRDDSTLYRTPARPTGGRDRSEHDGLSAEEMVVPLVMWELSR